MNQPDDGALVLELRHTGERLILRRARSTDGFDQIQLEGSLPPQREGPPLHIHTEEDEHGEVISGTLSAMVDGKMFVIEAGGSASFRRGSAHRWWNAGDHPVTFRGVVTPAVDLDRFLHALFEVVNAGSGGRPPLFHFAHVLYRHRRTQRALVMAPLLQSAILPIIVAVGTVLGKYRGTGWPGCPARCTGAPAASRQNA